MNATMSPLSLKVSRVIKAPRARVFDAWTKPELIMKWLGPNPCQITSARTDLRVGGEYVFNVRNPEGEKVVQGEYREITPPSRLVFTWFGTCPGAKQTEPTLVTVVLSDKNGGTEVSITHEGFASAESCDGHNQGWTGSLDRMEKLFE